MGADNSVILLRRFDQRSLDGWRLLRAARRADALCPLVHFPLASQHQPPSSTSAVAETVQRLLKPGTATDCPACRRQLALPPSAPGPPLPVRPWREVKNRRGAPKRITTHGFAGLNSAWAYYRITVARFTPSSAMRPWQGRAYPDLSLSSLWNDLRCPPRHAPLLPQDAIHTYRGSPDCAGRRAERRRRRGCSGIAEELSELSTAFKCSAKWVVQYLTPLIAYL